MLIADRVTVDKPLNSSRIERCIDYHESLVQQVKNDGITDEQLIENIKQIRKDVRRNRPETQKIK